MGNASSSSKMELSGFRNSIVQDNINEFPRNRDYDDFMMDDLKASRRASMMERSRTTIERDFAQSQQLDARNDVSGQISVGAAAPEKCKCFYSTKLVLKIFISVLVFTNLLTAAVVGGGVHLYYDKHVAATGAQCRHEVEETKHLYGDSPVYGRSHLYGGEPPYGTQRIGNSPPPYGRRPVNPNPRYRKQQISVNPTYTKQQVAEKPNYKTYRILLRPPTAGANGTENGNSKRAEEEKKLVARSQVASINASLATVDTSEVRNSDIVERFHQGDNIREPKELLTQGRLQNASNSTASSSSPSTTTTNGSSLDSTTASSSSITSSIAAALVSKQSVAETLCDSTQLGQEIVQCCSEKQDKSTCKKAIVIRQDQRFQVLGLNEECVLHDRSKSSINITDPNTVILLSIIVVLVLSFFACVLFLQRQRRRKTCECEKVHEDH